MNLATEILISWGIMTKNHWNLLKLFKLFEKYEIEYDVKTRYLSLFE
jgi:hypothetical protein